MVVQAVPKDRGIGDDFPVCRVFRIQHAQRIAVEPLTAVLGECAAV